MANLTLTTGKMKFSSNQPEDGDQSASRPMHILLIGNYSGRSDNSVSSCKIREVDKDNFEDVFSALNVSIRLPYSDDRILFGEFEDLTPDYLYSKISLFKDLKALRKKLLSPGKFNEAAEEIMQWAQFKEEVSKEQVDTRSDQEAKKSGLLDSILSSAESSEKIIDSNSDVNRLIRDIVKPHINRTDSRQKMFLDAVDQANSNLMHQILKDDAFRKIESAWRSLDLLVRRIELGTNLKLFVLDIREEELQAYSNLDKDAFQVSGLYQDVVEKNTIPGASHFSIIQTDFFVSNNEADKKVIQCLSHIADEIDASVLLSSEINENEIKDLDHSLEWKSIQDLDAAQRVAVFTPKFLLRLPYGIENNSIDSFKFEEVVNQNDPESYLWGKSAYLATLLLAQTYSEFGWSFNPGENQEITDMPLLIVREDGESVAKPNTEYYVTEQLTTSMRKVGIQPVSAVKGSTSIIAPYWGSIQPEKPLKGPWSEF